MTIQEELNRVHDAVKADPISVNDLDKLIGELAEREAEKDVIEANLKEKNKEIAALEIRATEVLNSLERDDYDSPFGKISFKTIMNVKLPTEENKEKLWAWMKEQGIFERYATVHATAFKSLFKSERDLAIADGADPITFALPGTEPATFFEKLEFKPKRK